MNNKIYVLNKQAGISSNKAMLDFKNENNIKKIGYVGTLDPFATGVLILCSGSYTKLVDYFHNYSKTYIATIVFAKSTPTLDCTSEINYQDDFILDQEQLQKTLDTFSNYDQMPPAFSAKRVNGKRAYEYARQGQEVTLKTKNVTIFNSKILSCENNTAVVEFSCSSGTYIRVLADDVAKKMNTRAYLSALQRTSVGHIDLNTNYITPKDALKLKTITCDNDFEKKLILCGNMPNNIKESHQDISGLVNVAYQNKDIAIYNVTNNKWKVVLFYNN